MVWRYLWSNSDVRIWHTLAEVEVFVFLFVIGLAVPQLCCEIVAVATKLTSTVSEFVPELVR